MPVRKGRDRDRNVPGNQGTKTSGQADTADRMPEPMSGRPDRRDRLIKCAAEQRRDRGRVPPHLHGRALPRLTEHIPFTGYGYELNAAFRTRPASSTKNSPVRIAGVDVGKVDQDRRPTAMRPRSPSPSPTPAGRSTPTPTRLIKPRIFLEGNFFIELDRQPERAGHGQRRTIPVSRTSTAVQIDEIFTSLQSPVRADFAGPGSVGGALSDVPTAAEDATQLPEMQARPAQAACDGAAPLRRPQQASYSAQTADAPARGGSADLPQLVAGRAAPSAPSSTASPTSRT